MREQRVKTNPALIDRREGARVGEIKTGGAEGTMFGNVPSS